ncbi:putative permease [Rivularia sp. PCC 7116]|uniref:LptF/LptG family permease n=1 Tax=Rivularia sp. PCC 7116 TaxID=373994 RepID=UPI00029ECDD4|nr:LptF/LptG family permease [Rivularia sp. PCC 7116]AFY57526.1 putative permease [Rivularia sp. PCC 7116]
MKKLNILPQFSILERYIIKELIPPSILGLAASTVVVELIGISFEQAKFVANRGLPFSTSLYIHLLKFPAFIAVSLPITMLLASIFVYGKLSIKSEILAFQSHGISLYRLIFPALITSLIVAFIMLFVNEIIVPPANYQAAITLEESMDVHRDNLVNKNIVYRDFYHNNHQLKILFYAESFTAQKMQDVTLLIYNQYGDLKEIIKSYSAEWNNYLNKWIFDRGEKNLINRDGSYGELIKFERLSVNLDRKPLDLANHNFDNREMGIFAAYKRLSILQTTGDEQSIRKLRVNIQERYAVPFSCFVFTLFGSALGINPQPKARSNALGITIMIIFGYYMIRVISTGLGTAGVISIFWGVWLPNILGIGIGSFLLIKKSC